MKKFLFFLLLWAGIVPANANGIPAQGGKNRPASSGKEASSAYFGGKKILIAYFPGAGTPKGWPKKCSASQAEGYDIADMLVGVGYQCFVVNYRISPYTMQESATDLQRAIRYIRAHADDYGIDPEDIALVGFSAGGILNGEVLLHWRNLANASTLVPDYEPDELDQIPVDACAIGMIYAFYGRLSVSMNDVETLREADLPPAFYCWGENDGFAGQSRPNQSKLCFGSRLEQGLTFAIFAAPQRRLVAPMPLRLNRPRTSSGRSSA